MFATPETDPIAAVRAAERTHDLILEIVAEVVGPRPAPQHRGLLLTSAPRRALDRCGGARRVEVVTRPA